LKPEFYARPTNDVALDLVGCVVRCGASAGVIVETEAYHESEPACHAHVGRTARTHVLFEAPGRAYVYRSYGIHAMLNAVTEDTGVGAAVLIRALEPTEGIEAMRERRPVEGVRELCSGPGKLTQALGIELGMNGTSLAGGPITIEPRVAEPRVVTGVRIGITKAAELPWRYCDADSAFVSRPLPAAMRASGSGAPRRRQASA
jgi:DNA-3-methyladenine glycosylase